MIQLSSAGEAADAVTRAHDVSVLAYTLRRGPVVDALERAAAGGAHVRVRLEGEPFGDPNGALARHNREIAEDLRRSGVDTLLSRLSRGDAPVHAKAIVADERLFLDDRNWGASDFVIADDDARAARYAAGAMVHDAACDGADAPIALHKRSALERESILLHGAKPGDDVIVESESFGYANPVCAALDTLAQNGVAVRLLVCTREARNDRESKALARLAHDGVSVRLTEATEKFAFTGTSAWIGSANASPDFGKPDMLDWGLITSDRAIVDAVRARVEARWAVAKRLSRPTNYGSR